MMIIFALSFNMLMGQAGLLSFCHPFVRSRRLQHRAFPQRAGAGDLPVPMELIPLLAGLSGLGFAARVRLRRDQTTLHRVRHDHARDCRTGHHRGDDVPSFLRRRGRDQHRPDDRPQPVRPGIRLLDRGLLSHRRLDTDRRHRHVFPYQYPARPHGQRVPRQLRTRAVRRLRPAHGALRTIQRGRILSPVSPEGCSRSLTRSLLSTRSPRRSRRTLC